MANRTCSINDCERTLYAHGWCNTHYQRWVRTGSVAADQPVRIIGDDWGRFWQYVDVGDCWEWIGDVGEDGYGRFYADQRMHRAHRWLYEHMVGPIDTGLDLDHLCRNRPCVNPDHLEPVTRRENLIRGATIIAAQLAATHCPAGHPYNDENTYRNGNQRRCRACQKQRDRGRPR